jgi:nucleoid-associated protein YgaU
MRWSRWCAVLTLGLGVACGGGAAGGPTPTAAPTTAAAPATAASPQRPALASPVPSPSTASPAGTSAAGSPTEVAGGGGGGETYEVQAGDTLGIIAEKFYGDSTMWRPIYDANKDAIGPDPDKLKLGMQLKIPPKPS